MFNIRQENESIRKLIHKAYYQSSMLDTIITGTDEATPHFTEELDKLTTMLEDAVLYARALNEYCYIDIQPLEKVSADFDGHWAGNVNTGAIEVNENGWLHITLNTLLPHCKQKSSKWLRNTILRLLNSYRQTGHSLPYFERAMLVVDEHCNIENRQIYDQDNKSWKAIPNALKGLVIADDDQFSLGLLLMSTVSDAPACHIYVMDIADAEGYLSLHHGECGGYWKR